MSVDTNLYVGNRWELNDIKHIIEREYKTTVRVESNHTTSMGYFNFFFKAGNEERMMHVHTQTETPLGRCTLLSLNHWGKAVEIMRTIADVLGGILEENDCNGNMEMVMGKIYDGDALQYFLKYAVIHDGIEADDIQGLKKSIEKWHKKHGK
jgi:hypothetical protein